MNVEFYRGDKRVKQTELIEFLESAVHHFIGMWGVSYEKVNIFIDLSLDKEKYDFGEISDKNPPLGGTLKLDDGDYLIFLDIQEIEDSFGVGTPHYWMYLLSALAHECVHVKQYMKKELDLTDDAEPLWLGEKVSHLSYRDTPHEIEAYSHQDDMAIDFFDSLSYADIDE